MFKEMFIRNHLMSDEKNSETEHRAVSGMKRNTTDFFFSGIILKNIYLQEKVQEQPRGLVKLSQRLGLPE